MISGCIVFFILQIGGARRGESAVAGSDSRII